MIIYFDKEKMMEDDGFYLRQMAKEIPITIGRMEKLMRFACDYVDTRNKVIKKYETEGKDTTNLATDRDWGLYVLGLGDRPNRFAKVIL